MVRVGKKKPVDFSKWGSGQTGYSKKELAAKAAALEKNDMSKVPAAPPLSSNAVHGEIRTATSQIEPHSAAGVPAVPCAAAGGLSACAATAEVTLPEPEGEPTGGTVFSTDAFQIQVVSRITGVLQVILPACC